MRASTPLAAYNPGITWVDRRRWLRHDYLPAIWQLQVAQRGTRRAG